MDLSKKFAIPKNDCNLPFFDIFFFCAEILACQYHFIPHVKKENGMKITFIIITNYRLIQK